MEGKKRVSLIKVRGLAGSQEVWVRCPPRSSPPNLRLLTGDTGVREPTSQLPIAVELSTGHSGRIFPGCYIILFPVSESKKSVSPGTLLCGMGSGEQSPPCLGSVNPSFWRPQILLGSHSAPSPSLGVCVFVKCTPVWPGAMLLGPAAILALLPDRFPTTLKTPQGGVNHSISLREKKANALCP